MFKTNMFFLAAALTLAPCTPVSAQEADYAPVMASFDGKDALVLSPSPALDINGFGTIEFWVAAKWTSDPGYDPAIMGYSGPKGARFALHITRDATALGIQAGPYYETVDFDFSDRKLHHVAITTIGETISVMIDGELQDTLGFGFANVPVTSFSIGSVGRFSPFVGDIGQVRIWDEPVDPDILVNFSWRAIEGEGRMRIPIWNRLSASARLAIRKPGVFCSQESLMIPRLHRQPILQSMIAGWTRKKQAFPLPKQA
ncbi:MAG: LamG domain-containing protein [Sphingomonadales bacterium]|nr:LamG domain-containing protein [Sphingomonadales bacterium]